MSEWSVGSTMPKIYAVFTVALGKVQKYLFVYVAT